MTSIGSPALVKNRTVEDWKVPQGASRGSTITLEVAKLPRNSRPVKQPSVRDGWETDEGVGSEGKGQRYREEGGGGVKLRCQVGKVTRHGEESASWIGTSDPWRHLVGGKSSTFPARQKAVVARAPPESSIILFIVLLPSFLPPPLLFSLLFIFTIDCLFFDRNP